MSDKDELRSLDAWIAINLFDKHEFKPHHINNSLCAFCNHGIEFKGHWNKDWQNISGSLPRYSTDPADAMQVLSRCVEEKRLAISISMRVASKTWTVFHGAYKAEAETLPLAICLFARALFSKAATYGTH